MRCHLTSYQIQKLLSGDPITIRANQCGDGPQIIHLTRPQLQKLYSKNKVTVPVLRVRFTANQIKHNLKHGSGFDDVVDVAKALASLGIKWGANQAGKTLGSVAQGTIGTVPVIGAPLGSYANQGVQWGANKAGEALSKLVTGQGMKKRRKRKGKGVGESTGNALAAVGQVGVPLGKAIDWTANNTLGKIFGWGVGGALYPPGYGLGRGLLPPPIKGANSGAAGI
jgi:hypothetical protein